MAFGGNVRLGGEPVTWLTSMEPVPPKARRVTMLNGGEQSSPRAKGWHFILQYGSGSFAPHEALDELRTLLGSGPTQTITFTDLTGADVTKTILVDETIHGGIAVAGNAAAFSVELVEAA